MNLQDGEGFSCNGNAIITVSQANYTARLAGSGYCSSGIPVVVDFSPYRDNSSQMYLQGQIEEYVEFFQAQTAPNNRNMTMDETARRNHEMKAKATAIWNLLHGR
ncbi:hypothetical protein TB1_040597 [Malus domestica]